jgi:hypothetical protein
MIQLAAFDKYEDNVFNNMYPISIRSLPKYVGLNRFRTLIEYEFFKL